MNGIIPFQYKSEKVRVIRDESGELLWVAQDICDVLNHTNTAMALRGLDEDEKGVRKVYTLGGEQDVLIVNESGLYTLIIRSKKKEAKTFKRWITHEVLPTIRKTGSYAVPNARFINPDKVTFALLAQEYNGAIWIARNLGLDENQARLSANRAVSRQYGPSCMALLEVNAFKARSTHQHLTPSDIGKMLGDQSGRMVNLKLEGMGLQQSYRDHKGRLKWRPTKKGTSFAVMKDTGKRQGDGTPVTQLFWQDSVLGMLPDARNV